MREGYTFKYWRGAQYAAGADYKVEGDHAFTAEWEEKPEPTPVVPATGDGSGPLTMVCALAAISAMLVLGVCRSKRKSGHDVRFW